MKEHENSEAHSLPKPLVNRRILTGDRPTGNLHLGHYVGSLKSRVALQKDNKQFILIADQQALTDNYENPKKVEESVLTVMLDYLAVGIDPKLSTIFVQSQIPQISELFVYYLNLVGLGRLQRNPTVKTELAQKGFGDSIPAGFMCYPVHQAADITAFKADLVPVGEDQRPMIEQTNEIVRSFNRTYKTDVLKECEALIPAMGSKLPGIDGKAKMSKSLGNGIFLSDPADVVVAKVKKMFTDPNHLKVEDPGSVEGNAVFTYLDVFDPETESLAQLKADYQRGGVADGNVKARLAGVLNDFMEPIRTRRAQFAKDPGEVLAILKRGTEAARECAAQTLLEAKRAMGICYF